MRRISPVTPTGRKEEPQGLSLSQPMGAGRKVLGPAAQWPRQRGEWGGSLSSTDSGSATKHHHGPAEPSSESIPGCLLRFNGDVCAVTPHLNPETTETPPQRRDSWQGLLAKCSSEQTHRCRLCVPQEAGCRRWTGTCRSQPGRLQRWASRPPSKAGPFRRPPAWPCGTAHGVLRSP